MIVPSALRYNTFKIVLSFDLLVSKNFQYILVIGVFTVNVIPKPVAFYKLHAYEMADNIRTLIDLAKKTVTDIRREDGLDNFLNSFGKIFSG